MPVWPEHWHALIALSWMSTQWRVVAGAGGAHWLGLDYGALPVVLTACVDDVPAQQRQPQNEVLRQLRVMEAAAVAARNER